MTFEEIISQEPYSLDAKNKEKMLTSRLKELTSHHAKHCKEYSRILNCIGYDEEKVNTYKDLPFLPVRLFKELTLKSIPDEELVKTMTSSGTTGQAVSKIYLDRTTSANQQKTMVKIVSDYTGSSRVPMIILDTPSVVKDRRMFSARGAGILGFSILGSDKMYAFDDNMHLDEEKLKEFLNKHQNEKILLFGFTYIVWEYFYKELIRLKALGTNFDLSKGILIHGGGWKKLLAEAVSAEEFHKKLNDACGIDNIHDYYGMVEQTGCIYMQCKCGHLHASIFSDVIVRNPKDWSECKINEKGIIQVVSTIPESYPGHSLLTEDEGVILGEDDCPCGRKGKYFKILGRTKNAEIRGCSDTFTKLNDSVTSMSQQSQNDCLKNVSFLVGDENIVSNMPTLNSKMPFADEIVLFLNKVSSILMKDKNAKGFPDVITLAFWLRNSSINDLKNNHFLNRPEIANNQMIRLGRGLIFHIAPSNVPVNYAYSLFAGLMCGNANIVRVPSKKFAQIDIINNAINDALAEFPNMKSYISLVRYDRDKNINDYFSSLCDVRVIWGGDQTIEDIRKSQLKPKATEVTFADRFSLAIVDADFYMNVTKKCSDEKALTKIASDFYNDTYLSDQNACTSPKLIAWIGEKHSIEKAKEIFWGNVYKIVSNKYALPDIRAVDKLTMEYIAASNLELEVDSSTSDNYMLKEELSVDNLVKRISVNKPYHQLMKYCGNSGYFYECDINDVMEMQNICNDIRCQTISVCGDCEVLKPLIESGIKGIDRVVPLGKSMDFDLKWDGYDLVERFTRIISI